MDAHSRLPKSAIPFERSGESGGTPDTFDQLTLDRQHTAFEAIDSKTKDAAVELNRRTHDTRIAGALAGVALL